mmetsp:Transcript_23067/g.41875  ORF Transcript_23067/g.41875 Transcript_23067/m.41875 type:complete len:298 (-) Transcript_23067:29-922(-)
MTKPSKGIMMILSPAKTLNLSPLEHSPATTTIPHCNVEKTKEIMQAIKKRTQAELGKLLGISANLAQTAHEYWSNMETDISNRDSSVVKPCIYAFAGTAYDGVQVSSLDEDSLQYLQSNLRIIDPLYGVLRPLDIIQPYRLEMATRNVFPNDKSMKLATYWQQNVTERLSDDLTNRINLILLNLASDEYSAAVDSKILPTDTQYIRIVFQQEGRVIAVRAKRARGLMARYLAEIKAESLEDVKSFNMEGYSFVKYESNETMLVFDRKKQQAPKKRAATSKAPTTKKTAQASRKRRRS